LAGPPVHATHAWWLYLRKWVASSFDSLLTEYYMLVRTCKRRPLLRDPNIDAWHSNLCEGSEIAADVYLRCLGRLCEENSQTLKP